MDITNIPGCRVFYAITVYQPRPVYRERFYGIGLIYEDADGMSVIRDLHPNTLLTNKREAAKLFRDNHPDKPILYVRVHSYSTFNKAELL